MDIVRDGSRFFAVDEDKYQYDQQQFADTPNFERVEPEYQELRLGVE